MGGGGLKTGVKCVEVVRQGVCGTDDTGAAPVVGDVLQALPHAPGVSSGIEAVQLLSVLPLGCCDGLSQSVLRSFVLSLIARCKCSGPSTQHVTYLTVYPGLLVRKLPDLDGGHNILHTSANVPSHIVSIVLYTDRRVLQSGCSFKHIPVCRIKTVLQCALSLRCPELNLFDDWI